VLGIECLDLAPSCIAKIGGLSQAAQPGNLVVTGLRAI
jgi:hypothetical protein